MTSEAQKRARSKYDRAKMAQKVVRFSPRERDLLAHLEKQPNQMGYMKGLIRDDMKGRAVKTVDEIISNWETEDNDWYAVDEITPDGREIRLLVAEGDRAKRFAAEKVAGTHLVDYEGNPCEPGEFGDESYFRCQMIGSDEALAYFTALNS